MKKYRLDCCGKVLQISDQPLIMGILNVTPDSFSDGGNFFNPSAAVEHAQCMADDGADIIDVGGESTRPGAPPVPPDEQIQRICPVIWTLARQLDIPISVDTTSAAVAQAALEAGASVINDVSALRFDPEMAPLAARIGAPVILMHMLGDPRTMQDNPTYTDVIQEIKQFLAERIEFALAAGIDRSKIIIDPGIGFGKTVEHNLLLLKKLCDLCALDVPVLIGPSRKSFIGKVLGIEKPADRLFGTAAAVVACVHAGAQIIRVHDVKEMSQVVRLAAAIRGA